MTETNPLPKATQADAVAFCGHCDWIYKCWSMHDALGERVDHREALSDSPIGKFLEHHMELSSEYTLLQAAKLHDPAVKRDQGNLTIDFFLDQEDVWSSNEKEELDGVRSKLHAFYNKRIKRARNKIFAHNDLKTFRNNTPLGGFPKSEGESYLSDLGEIAAAVWKNWDCRMEKPYQGSERVFHYFLNGPIWDQIREDAKSVIDAMLR